MRNQEVTTMNIHFYMLCFRYEALVASHLDPIDFGRYMAMGTQKHTRGNVLFFEIDPDLKSDYFKLDDIQKRCAPHEDGSPKRSKYISVYRVLEHLPLAAFDKLYLVTADGRVMYLSESQHPEEDKQHDAHLFQELCPLSPMVASALQPSQFCKFITDPQNPIHIPRIFFADLLAERDESGHLAGYLPYSDPMHILDCLKDVEKGLTKTTKTISRNPVLHGFFRTINRGFYLGDLTGVKFYRFPERRTLEVEYARWWRSASESLS
jgi:hypothetical protein